MTFIHVHRDINFVIYFHCVSSEEYDHTIGYLIYYVDMFNDIKNNCACMIYIKMMYLMLLLLNVVLGRITYVNYLEEVLCIKHT